MVRRLCAFVGTMTLFAALAAFSDPFASGAEPSKSSPPGISPATPLVEQALEAEAAGKVDERADFLRRAIEADPSYAPAHWHNGEIRVKDHWLPIDDAAQQMARDGKVNEYRRLRNTPRPTPLAQRQLGDWCATAGLDAQARVHWMMALALQPGSQPTMAKLRLVRHGQSLVPSDKLDDIKRQEKAVAAANKTWTRRLETLRADSMKVDTARRAAAIQELSEIRDPAAIPAMETFAAKGTEEFGEALVASLSGMPEQEAVDSLVRHAIYSPHDGVRQSAAEALKERSLFAYVPTLIGILQAPIKIEFEEYVENGDPRHRLALYQDGPQAAQAIVSAGGYSQHIEIKNHPNRGTQEIKEEIKPDVTLEQDRALARQAEDLNAQAKVRNEFATAALAAATGKQLGDDPADWWKWWLDYNEIYQYPEKPVVVTARNYTPRPSRVRVSYSSCFVAGTVVWTMDGPMAIENVRPGECVLSQSPATGELAYKAVVDTTVRPISPVLAIKTEGDTILATRGHPFWVCGAGWRMTKELKAGDWLHTVGGPVEITSAKDAGEAVCYNLVVDDFGTYFVGEQKTLVHDNTIRDVTPAVVPGLVER